jgi:hypothetical protein
MSQYSDRLQELRDRVPPGAPSPVEIAQRSAAVRRGRKHRYIDVTGVDDLGYDHHGMQHFRAGLVSTQPLEPNELRQVVSLGLEAFNSQAEARRIQNLYDRTIDE